MSTEQHSHAWPQGNYVTLLWKCCRASENNAPKFEALRNFPSHSRAWSTISSNNTPCIHCQNWNHVEHGPIVIEGARQTHAQSQASAMRAHNRRNKPLPQFLCTHCKTETVFRGAHCARSGDAHECPSARRPQYHKLDGCDKICKVAPNANHKSCSLCQ